MISFGAPSPTGVVKPMAETSASSMSRTAPRADADAGAETTRRPGNNDATGMSAISPKCAARRDRKHTKSYFVTTSLIAPPPSCTTAIFRPRDNAVQTSNSVCASYARVDSSYHTISGVVAPIASHSSRVVNLS